MSKIGMLSTYLPPLSEADVLYVFPGTHDRQFLQWWPYNVQIAANKCLLFVRNNYVNGQRAVSSADSKNPSV